MVLNAATAAEALQVPQAAMWLLRLLLPRLLHMLAGPALALLLLLLLGVAQASLLLLLPHHLLS